MTEDELIGKSLDEYRLESLLGQGGMARVYRALDTRLDRQVAIKVIDSPLRGDSDYVLRFDREAKAIARLEHPHIVRLYRYGEVDGLLYMAMQHVDGVDLYTLLNSFRQEWSFIVPDDARRIIREVCEALDYAHSQGVIHRDVKPGNVLLSRHGEVLLTDFGLALLTDLGTRGEIFGSPHYIAPEQAISSARAVPQSDLYSIGVILFEMFTGEVPFDAAEALDISMLHMTEAPPLPRSLRPEISPALEQVILKTLSKEPQERYPDGKSLAAALDKALSSPASAASFQTTLVRPVFPVSHPESPQEEPIMALPPLPAAVAQVQPPEAEFPDEPLMHLGQPVGRLSSRKAPGGCMLLGLGVGGLALLILAVFGIIWFSGRIPAFLVADNAAAEGESTPAAAEEQVAAASEEPAIAPSATSQATEEASRTPVPPTPTLTPPPPSATPSATVYIIRIVVEKRDSFVVVNESEAAFPLRVLTIFNDKGSIDAEDWPGDFLEPGECIAVRKDKGNPKLPRGYDCETYDALERPANFWEEAFSVQVAEQVLRERCNSGECLYQVEIQP